LGASAWKSLGEQLDLPTTDAQLAHAAAVLAADRRARGTHRGHCLIRIARRRAAVAREDDSSPVKISAVSNG
jgi:hypothetical protein